MTRKNADNMRGRPFEKGNPGRPKGALNKTTLAAQALLDGEAEVLTRKAIEKAKEGDITAIRLCLDRIVPPRKDRPIAFPLPVTEKPDDVGQALAAVLSAVAEGEITPSEGQAVASVLESQRKALELVDIERRLRALEARA